MARPVNSISVLISPAPAYGTCWLVGAAFLCLACAFPVRAEPIPAEQVVQRIAENVMQEVRFRGEDYERNPDSLYRMVEERLLPHFDMERISRHVLGPFWEQATIAQRERFVTAFQFLLIRQYATALLGVRDDVFEWQPTSLADEGRDALVSSHILRTEGPPLSVKYRLYRTDHDWLLYDLAIDGISLSTNYRGMFIQELRRNGLDSLILRLEQKISS